MTDYLKLADAVLDGHPLDEGAAAAILAAEGAELTAMLAGAHRLREAVFGNRVETCAIINAKSGRCGENCAFCAQSAHHRTDAPVYGLKSVDEMLAGAARAAREGAHCYGIVTSGTRIKAEGEWEALLETLRRIRQEHDVDPSASLGLLDAERAAQLAEAGCVTYHHNLETARSFFPEICTTHAYDEDVETVRVARAAGMRVCCGGILGLGESPAQRVELAFTLRELAVDSVPLNFLNPVEGTRLAGLRQLSPTDCLRAIALFRFALPRQRISVCGGREPNLRDLQSWMFAAGASGTMVGAYLTTTGRDREEDLRMIADAGFVLE
jgi:biotin synthase